MQKSHLLKQHICKSPEGVKLPTLLLKILRRKLPSELEKKLGTAAAWILWNATEVKKLRLAVQHTHRHLMHPYFPHTSAEGINCVEKALETTSTYICRAFTLKRTAFN
jgi:hypothetical protein